MNFLKKIGLLAFSIIAFKASAQTDKATTAKIIAEKNYIFIATSAIPMNSSDMNKVFSSMSGNTSGGMIALSGSNYDFKVTTDSLISYLPYYGRAYTSSFNSDESGIKFTSKDFTYNVKNRKKGGWEIIIITKDVKDNVRMSLSVSENGYASLSVNSNNKQSISFNGYLQEAKKKVL